ncbi:hypothetical protein ACIQOU_28260 [Streptomyces sp. NPDC091279]|uniref:hypothetical protein n=1 Tax=Streptomyces sp. NPDC091279 TaxID=3365983 RepID=UPI00380F807C
MSAVDIGLARAVLRLHRHALAVWGAFVVLVVAALVLLVEVVADRVHDKIATCARTTGVCAASFSTVDYGIPLNATGNLVTLGFWAVAAWAGGALIARELENGTARLAWTQGVSPGRWLAAKLALPALTLVAGAGVLVAAFRWAWAAHPDLADADWSASAEFLTNGPALIAYALCGLAVGTLTGLLLRRQLAALGVSLALAVAFGRLMDHVRPHLWPTVTRTGAGAGDLVPAHAWEVAASYQTHGTSWATFHPASHFWPIHLAETSIALAVATLATAAAFTVQRRTTA